MAFPHEQVKCCSTCAKAEDRRGSAMLFCRPKGDVVAAWSSCKDHTTTKDENEEEDEIGGDAA